MSCSLILVDKGNGIRNQLVVTIPPDFYNRIRTFYLFSPFNICLCYVSIVFTTCFHRFYKVPTNIGKFSPKRLSFVNFLDLEVEGTRGAEGIDVYEDFTWTVQETVPPEVETDHDKGMTHKVTSQLVTYRLLETELQRTLVCSFGLQIKITSRKSFGVSIRLWNLNHYP